jgi:hypothetical protein
VDVARAPSTSGQHLVAVLAVYFLMPTDDSIALIGDAASLVLAALIHQKSDTEGIALVLVQVLSIVFIDGVAVWHVMAQFVVIFAFWQEASGGRWS